ncbi:hypothetical protein SUGI_0605770 [Cryptomeria japonica]|uniref:uncharacterized protein LOC131063510 n=1 Tax=Cryptomeria japonica TaxID=3369 RepID=UPI0024146AFC|nr:uncharacterized protein LOC131063510 [Cryptomeria japonica]XP_057853338.2 uncharacterized protein LOC131063510 [Cryptomeria japonica]XP_057853339.2 uncharacterized protein LOC131063510 [Cryptomeria japonica]XP_057853340.2 uncharacterized protein LOC131063510 [Cryptomeria japonica]XP_057853341.2 uncharacterized protein LOC131063510 [Cryptomeria japonica]XP_057853342.2 uncharacterized protein LOC131063510 [Cryptomeria japonica]GLJ30593.1 hypothetical protein SUGI_0605770 [Cryptomeria japonic
MEGHNLLEDHKCSGSGPISVDNCGSNSMEEIPKQDSNVDFDPCAPYSSSMDNVPLKLLFGVSNVKMRHSPTQEKAVQMDLCSPKDQLDSSESVRVKLRESLTSALALVCDEQQKKDSITEQNLKIEMVVPERPSNLDRQYEEMEPMESIAETHLHYDNESPKILKRDREDFEQKHQLGEDAISSCYIAQAAHEEQDERPSLNADSSVMSTDMSENGSLKRIKLEKEEFDTEKSEQSTQISDIIQFLGVKIEAELFRKYAGVNKKYKEKARSLLFNLKDRNNPELRARVVSGEITPENLCCMTAEQLASKELSQWRIAKAEELAHMIVLPDNDVNFRRMVKKTHKGEFQVEVENDDVGAEIAASGLPLQSKLEQPETEDPSMDEIANSTGIHDDNRIASPTSLPSCTSPGRVAGMAGSKIRSTEGAAIRKTREEKILPKIMSLDDYMGSRSDKLHEGAEVRSWNEESTEWATEANVVHNKESIEWEKSPPGQPNVEEDKAGFTNDHFVHGDLMHIGSEMDYPNGDQEWPIGKGVQSPSSEKLWEGMLQLNPLIVETVVALFKSGEKTSAKEWSKFVEVKGRVRIDAFEKFLQELPLSRSRAVMVVSICCKTASLENSLENIQEIAISYKQDERVGYAEPAPGVELYLCPSNVATLQMLDKFISYEHFENINEQDGLIGFVVWRRNNVTSNAMHTMPEKQYINAKQLALSGHMLDSPTHPGVSESVPHGTDSPKNDISTSYDKYPVSNKLPFMVSTSKTITHVENTTHAKDCSEMDIPPGFNSCPPRVASIDPRINAPKFQVSILHDDDDDDLIDDVPPGFGPNAASVINNAYTQTNTTNLDDDDLPEFDYNGVSASYQPPSSQLPPQRCLQPMPNSQCPSQPPQVSTNTDQVFFQSKDSFHPPVGHLASHQIPQQVPRPPATPHPSIQIRELIQKYGQCDAPFSMGHSCTPDVGVVNFAPQIGQQPVMIPPHHTPTNAHTQVEKLWNGEDVPEWRLYFTPGTSLMQQMQPMIPPQLGAPNGNFQVGQCLPSRVPAPQRGPPQMLIPLGAPMQMLQPPPNLPQVPPHPSFVGMRPITGINLPVPMLMSEREHGQFYANNSQTFHTSYNFRPALSGPDTRPLDGRNRRV